MNQSNLYANKSAVKFFDGFFASIGITSLILTGLEFLPIGMYDYSIRFMQLTYRDLLFVAIGFAYMLYAGYREKNGRFNSEKAHALLLGIIRFSLAAGISSYGFAKILGGQMGPPGLPIKDAKISDLTDAWLTFYYFGSSRTFTMVIAAIEIIGPFLLLFRRTVLLGALVLLPTMFTIFLLNSCYNIGAGALGNSAFYTLGSAYLILLHWEKVREFFRQTNYTLPKVSTSVINNIFRVAVLLLAFMSTYQWRLRFPEIQKADAGLLGKWNVEQRFVNGRLALPNAWESDENIWSNFYFIDGQMFAFSNNPYYYASKTGGFSGSYKFDKQNKTMQLYFFQTRDTLKATVELFKDDKLVLKGLLKKDTISLNLKRVKKLPN